MPRNKKKFIDKKKAVTFRLVPRCQLDPDGDASEHVLVPVNASDLEKFNIKLPECVLPPSAKQIPSLKKEMQIKGPRPDWDPDIVAALDDDFDYEDSANALEDDFIAKANGPVDILKSSDEDESGSEDSDSSNGFLFSDDDDSNFGHDGYHKKGGLSQYSMTSAVSNCTEEFKIFNERFDKLCESYADDQIGGLEFEKVEGCVAPPPPDSSLMNDFALGLKNLKKSLTKVPYSNSNVDEDLKHKTLHFARNSHKEEFVEILIKKKPQFDCESILSTRSTQYNHPTVIKAEKKEKKVKTKVPEEVPEPVKPVFKVITARAKDETPEEKKERKQAMKEMKRASRQFKKENAAFQKQIAKQRNGQKLNIAQNRVIHIL